MATSSDRVYSELRKRLMSGAFLPGERLREEHLAGDLKVSRTPVRTAIQRLVKDGLVSIEEHRGAVAIGWTDRDILEAFEIRLLLEPYTAGVAAQNATPEEIAELNDLNERMEGAIHSQSDTRIETIQKLNNQFHHKLLHASHSARLRALVSGLLDMPMMIGSFYFYTDSNLLDSVEHHRRIIQALQAGNRRLAEAAMEYHLLASQRLFETQRHRPA